MKKVLPTVVVLLTGYVLGALIDFPKVDLSLVSGDIGMATRYSKPASVEVKAFQERLETDTLFRKNVVTGLVINCVRISQFQKLIEATDSFAGNIAALEECARPILAMKEFAGVAKANADTTLTAFTALLKGEGIKSGYDYESLSQKIMISNLALDKQYDAVRNFVTGVDSYLKQNKEKVDGLRELRDSWVLFTGCEAALNGRKIETDYWKQQNMLSDKEDLLNIFPGLSGFPDNENLLNFFPGFSGFPDNENLLNIFPGLSGFPDNENLLNIFPGLSGFPDNENLLNIFPGLPAFPDNESLLNVR